ncbi:uncharacterized protein FFB14_00147 [Fusarium fujikuroi]|nr:uncharacterized protein FFB14_00147 [Fusarium fujikuroi]
MVDNSTASALAGQWRNPAGFMSLLMIIGGPVIQSALAQLTGPSFVPICFSFGWVSYAFSTISVLVGDGRLMPLADYACKVINLENGYTRTNRSWIVGRLLRDLEKPLLNEALRVEVYEAVDPPRGKVVARGRSRWFGSGAILIQLGITIIPLKCFSDWGPLMITILGTCGAVITAALPQWRVEKLACRAKSAKRIAITTGNGSRHVIVILGNAGSLDIEDLAAGEGPRQPRSWNEVKWCVKYVDETGKEVKVSRTEAFKEYMKEKDIVTVWNGTWLGIWSFQWYKGKGGKPVPRARSKDVIEAYMEKRKLTEEARLFRSLPIGFWITRLLCGFLILLWAAVLISVMALKERVWYLVGVGTVGLVHNATTAAMSRTPESRGIHLKRQKMVFTGQKVMDVLMDLDTWEPGCGRSLLKEFFPAGLDVDKDRGETDWWEEKKRKDDEIRGGSREKSTKQNAQLEANCERKDKYDQERYKDENCGKRYDSEEIESPNVPSRGKRWGGITRRVRDAG